MERFSLSLFLVCAITVSSQLYAERYMPDPVTRPKDYAFWKDQQYKQLQDSYQRAYNTNKMQEEFFRKNNPGASTTSFYEQRQQLSQQYSSDFSALTNRIYGTGSSTTTYPSLSSSPTKLNSTPTYIAPSSPVVAPSFPPATSAIMPAPIKPAEVTRQENNILPAVKLK